MQHRSTDDDLERRLAAFIGSQGPRDVAVAGIKRYTVGFSWLTYGFAASWRGASGRESHDLILRLGPPNGVFAPYRAKPEFDVLRCLEGKGVPVPHVRWFSDDPAVLGGPFFIADKVAGEAPIPWTAHGGDAFEPDVRRSIGEQFLLALVALHRFEWRGTPAAELAGSDDPRDTAQAQIAIWEGYMRRWSRRRLPLLEWALLWLARHAPEAPRVSVIHGDYRIGNFLVADGRITAVLDWELVHRGDPHEDLGWLCLQAFRGRSRYMCHLFEREELYSRYETLSGAPVSRASAAYYEAFGAFKLAVIHLAAVHSFEEQGFNDLRMPAMGAQIPRVLLQVEKAIGAAEALHA